MHRINIFYLHVIMFYQINSLADYLFMYLYLYLLKSILSILFRTTLETSVLLCALMCLSSVNIIYMLILLFAYASY